mgnify:CR=1 FL=1
MAQAIPFNLNLLEDDLSRFTGKGAAFVTFGETMLRDTPVDEERLERTRQVWLSLAGSELSVAVLLSRLGIPATYITRLPDNPYGWMVRNVAREQGVNCDYFVWADKTEPIGRYLYEIGRTPRPSAGWYQRKYSAASKLGAGMVDWKSALQGASVFHTTGISFGLSAHSGYERNYLLEAFQEALSVLPSSCRVGMDFNYRSTLWSVAECQRVITPLLSEHVDILITTVVDLVRFFGLRCEQLTSEMLEKGEEISLSDENLQALMQQAMNRFDLQVVALTMRHADSLESQRWESAVLDSSGHFYRSPAPGEVVLWDRLGGGDAWTAGFYYGLLTEEDKAKALQKGILVGDAATRLKQTLMFDLPVITRQDIQDLLRAYFEGSRRQVYR